MQWLLAHKRWIAYLLVGIMLFVWLWHRTQQAEEQYQQAKVLQEAQMQKVEDLAAELNISKNNAIKLEAAYNDLKNQQPVASFIVQAPSLQNAAEDVAERIQEKDTTLPAAALEKTDRTAVVANTQSYKVDVMKIDLDADWEVATGYGNHQGNGYIPLEVQRNYAKNKAVAVEVHLKPEGKVDVSGWEVKHVWRY